MRLRRGSAQLGPQKTVEQTPTEEIVKEGAPNQPVSIMEADPLPPAPPHEAPSPSQKRRSSRLDADPLPKLPSEESPLQLEPLVTPRMSRIANLGPLPALPTTTTPTGRAAAAGETTGHADGDAHRPSSSSDSSAAKSSPLHTEEASPRQGQLHAPQANSQDSLESVSLSSDGKRPTPPGKGEMATAESSPSSLRTPMVEGHGAEAAQSMGLGKRSFADVLQPKPDGESRNVPEEVDREDQESRDDWSIDDEPRTRSESGSEAGSGMGVRSIGEQEQEFMEEWGYARARLDEQPSAEDQTDEKVRHGDKSSVEQQEHSAQEFMAEPRHAETDHVAQESSDERASRDAGAVASAASKSHRGTAASDEEDEATTALDQADSSAEDHAGEVLAHGESERFTGSSDEDERASPQLGQDPGTPDVTDRNTDESAPGQRGDTTDDAGSEAATPAASHDLPPTSPSTPTMSEVTNKDAVTETNQRPRADPSAIAAAATTAAEGGKRVRWSEVPSGAAGSNFASPVGSFSSGDSPAQVALPLHLGADVPSGQGMIDLESQDQAQVRKARAARRSRTFNIVLGLVLLGGLIALIIFLSYLFGSHSKK